MTHTKAETISKIYNDLSGFESIKQTLEEASKINKTITLIINICNFIVMMMNFWNR